MRTAEEWMNDMATGVESRKPFGWGDDEGEPVVYANIEKAHLEIAYDNGGINRDRSEEKATRDLRRFLPKLPYDHAQLSAIDTWLGALSQGDLETLCAGEQSEQDALLEHAPPHTMTVLTEIFDHVC